MCLHPASESVSALIRISQIYNCTIYYRPQRSWAKVMFLQASVILSTGGSVSVHAGIPPPKSRPPKSRPPLEQTPPGADPPRADPPGSRHPPEQTPRKQTPAYSQRVAGTHPTGMHSCTECHLKIGPRPIPIHQRSHVNMPLDAILLQENEFF